MMRQFEVFTMNRGEVYLMEMCLERYDGYIGFRRVVMKLS